MKWRRLTFSTFLIHLPDLRTMLTPLYGRSAFTKSRGFNTLAFDSNCYTSNTFFNEKKTRLRPHCTYIRLRFMWYNADSKAESKWHDSKVKHDAWLMFTLHVPFTQNGGRAERKKARERGWAIEDSEVGERKMSKARKWASSSQCDCAAAWQPGSVPPRHFVSAV